MSLFPVLTHVSLISLVPEKLISLSALDQMNLLKFFGYTLDLQNTGEGRMRICPSAWPASFRINRQLQFSNSAKNEILN